MGPAIRIDRLTVRYAESIALEDVSLEVGPGSVCGVVGINGSGKSTLLKTILGAVRPTAGTVTIGGLPPAQSRKAGLLGYVPQDEHIDHSFPISVEDVVMMGRYGHMRSARAAGESDRRAVTRALARVDMTALQGRRIGALSGGQRKRAFVARALAQEASILALDEPFNGLDGASRDAVTSVLRELAGNGGTVLIATHDLRALPALCDEVVVLRRRMLFHGEVDEALRPENIGLAFGLDPAMELEL